MGILKIRDIVDRVILEKTAIKDKELPQFEQFIFQGRLSNPANRATS
jgi:hypothetical protein